MAPSLDILDILPSTSEESVSQRANELVPKCLLYPVPSFDELRYGNFYLWQNNTKISSIEGTRQLLGNQLYNYIDGHPLREHIQSKLEEYQNDFLLVNIAKEIENQLPKENRLDPLGKNQMIKLFEILTAICIPEWAYPSNERSVLSNRLASAIATAKDWNKIIKSTDDNFAYAALSNFVEQARSTKLSKLNFIVDSGGIFRNVLLKAVSRCLGPFFIRCVIYIFRKFTTPQAEKNIYRWSINMGALQSTIKGGLVSPNHSSFSGSRSGHVSGRPSVSSTEEPFRSPRTANFPSPRPGGLPNFASPSRPAPIGNRTTSLEGERPRPSGAITPRAGAVFNRSKALSVDDLPPPPTPPLSRFPRKRKNPNLVEIATQSTPPRKRPPTTPTFPSPAQNLASELSSPPPHQNEPIRNAPNVPPEGEPPGKRQKQPDHGWISQADQITRLLEENKMKTQEIIKLNKGLTHKAEERKTLVEQKEKAEADMKDMANKIRTLEEETGKKEDDYRRQFNGLQEDLKREQDKILELQIAVDLAQKAESQLKEYEEKVKQLEEKETSHKDQIQKIEEEAKQAQEKIKRLENVLESTANSHNEAGAETIHAWENKCNQLQKQLAKKAGECLTLERDKDQLRNDMKSLGLQFQAGPKREQRMKDTISRMDKEIFDLKQKLGTQGGAKIQQLEKALEEAEKKVTELEYKNREQVEQIDGLEKQSNEAQKQMLQEMRRANEQKKYYEEEKEQKEKMTHHLKLRHRQAEENEKALKERIANLEKELAVAKEEKNAETSKLDLTLKEKENDQDEVARIRIKEMELLNRLDILRSSLEKEKEKSTASLSELETIKKERDELKTNRFVNERTMQLERELKEKSEELLKTEAIFEQMEKNCEEKMKKIERLTKSVQDMEATRKNREEMWNITVGEHKKKLEEAENNKIQEVAAVTAKLTVMEKERDNEARERANLLKKQQSFDQKAAELEKIRTDAVQLAEKAKQEKEDLVKKHQEALEQLKKEHKAEKTELGKKVQTFKENTKERVEELMEKIDRTEKELQEAREKAANDLDENEKLKKENALQLEILLDLRKNINRAFPSQ